ncbi:MAG: DVUA0089 family protein [Planctomycetes bacterium]|jgi:hypothetical protein|nr:DVUA0089 family protein [Planctomycetota bacterium]
MFHRRLTIAVLLTAVGTASLRGQRINEIEPNDSLPTAQAVSLGEQVDAVLGAGDQDWFQFVVTTPTAVRLFTSPLGPVPVDTVLTLFDLAGIVVATNDDQRGVHSDISMRLAPGTYLVQVTGTGVLPTGDYSLDLGRVPAVPPPLVEAPEPNDSIQAATLVNCGSRLAGNFADPFDRDWYRVTLTAPRSAVVLRVLNGSPKALSAFDYKVRDSAGGLITATATLGANTGTGKVVGSIVRCLPASGPTDYYFDLGGNGGAGDYELEVAVMPLGLGLPIPESGITGIGPGQFAHGEITAAGEVDLYGPISVGSEFLFAQTDPRTVLSGALAGSRIQLLDHGFLPIGSPFTGGNLFVNGNHARAAWRLSGSGTVFIRVTAPPTAPNNIGGYRLEVGGCSLSSVYDSAGKRQPQVNVTCLGSNGLRPSLGTASDFELPVLGSTFVRHVTEAPPLSVGFLIQGLSDTMSAFGPLPLSLALIGAPGCTLDVDPVAFTLVAMDGAGRATIEQQTPPNASLSGFQIFEQALVFDPQANPFGATLSNVLVQRLGSLSF